MQFYSNYHKYIHLSRDMIVCTDQAGDGVKVFPD